MSDDLFVREVDEDLRSDRMNSLWKRFGPLLIGAAVLIVVGVGGWRGYEHWTTTKANASGDQFLAALNDVSAGNSDAALEKLAALKTDGYGAYPLLAEFRAATETAKTDPQAAIASFDAIAADSGAAAPLRDLANLRAAYLLVDHGDYAAVSQRAEALTATTNPWRFSASEALGLAAWKAGDNANALVFFETIINDSVAPSSLTQRATMMVELIGGQNSQDKAG